jgi:hypothetical protein
LSTDTVYLPRFSPPHQCQKKVPSTLHSSENNEEQRSTTAQKKAKMNEVGIEPTPLS